MCEENKSRDYTRSEAREQAFMLLFSLSFGSLTLDEVLADGEQLYDGGVCAYASAVAMGVEAKQDEIDALISRFLKKGWSLSRISKASLAILRLAFYEITYLENIPEKVSVNEAVELAKKYTIDEYRFVNGILGSYLRSRDAESSGE